MCIIIIFIIRLQMILIKIIKIFLYVFYYILGEHIRNWRQRYMILFEDGTLIGFKKEPGQGLEDPLNNFTVKGMELYSETCHNRIAIHTERFL